MATAINITMNRYNGNLGHNYRALNADITIDGLKKDVTTVIPTNPADFVNNVLLEVTGILIRGEYTPQDITVKLPAEVVISEALKTHIEDKFEADTLIKSVTFI